mgnify:CR=1 FL=1
MITEKNLDILNYICHQLGKRILPQYFYEKNPDLMNKWQNQICRQSHVITSYFLNKWLNKDSLKFNINFYESIFRDEFTLINYDHSWIFISSINNPKECYICDIARISSHIGFVKSNSNDPDLFLKDKEYKKMRKSYDYNELLKLNEYYTNIKGIDIVKDIEERLTKCRLNYECQ